MALNPGFVKAVGEVHSIGFHTAELDGKTVAILHVRGLNLTKFLAAIRELKKSEFAASLTALNPRAVIVNKRKEPRIAAISGSIKAKEIAVELSAATPEHAPAVNELLRKSYGFKRIRRPAF
jgi:hypothetical protein